MALTLEKCRLVTLRVFSDPFFTTYPSSKSITTCLVTKNGMSFYREFFPAALAFLRGARLCSLVFALFRAIFCGFGKVPFHLKHPTALLADQDRHYLSPLIFFHHGFLASGLAQARHSV